MTNVGTLTIEMAANIVRLQKDMDSARKTVDGAMASIQKSVGGAQKMLGALGIGLSIGAFASWIKGAIDATDAINDMSKATGIAGTTLFGLQYAAKMSGTTLEDTAAAINKLSVSIGGNVAKYEALGISAKDPVEAFKQLAEVFKATEDPQQRAAFAAEALGKSWQGVAGLLSEGADGIQELIDAGIELYGVTPEIIDGAARFNDQLDILSMRSQAAALQIAGPFLNSIVTAMEEMSKATQIAGGFWRALVTFGTMSPFGTLEEGVVKYKKEIEDLEKAITRYQKANSDTRGLEEALATTKQRLEFTQYRLNQQIAEQARLQREAATASDAHVAAYSKMKASADELIDQMTFEAMILGMTNEEREKSVALRKLEEIGIREGSAALDEYLPKIEAIVAQNKATRARIAADKDAENAAKQAANEAKRLGEERKRAIKSIEDEIEQLKFEVEYMGKSNLEKDQAIFLNKMLAAGIDDGTEAWKKYADAYQDALFQKEQLQAIIDSNKKIEEETKKAQEKLVADRLKQEEEFADEVKSINNQIGQSLTDALMQGGVNAKDFLLNMFKTMVLRPMLQPIITGFVGAFTSSAMAGATGEAAAEGATGGAIGTSMGLVGMASSLKSAYQMVTGGFASLGATVTSAAEGLGATLILENAPGSVLSSMGQSLASSASALGTIASYGAGIGAGLGLGNLISGGKGLGGGSSWLTVGGGTAIGAMVGGPLGAAIGGIVGGLANAAFGTGAKEIDDAGIKVRFNAMKTTVDAYEEWSKEGGWFGGGDDGVEITAVDAKLQKYFDTAVAATAINVKRYADVLGLSAAGISDFTFEVKQSLAGLSPEEAQKEIDRIITAYGNAMASVVTAEIGPVLREGEEAGVALARLASSLNAVNTVFGTLNLNLMETSIYGADAASKLLDLFGGIEEFTKATDYYYQNFYSTQERVAKTTEQLTDVFAQLGYELPSSRAAFRSLVESVQAAGNPNLFATLIQLAPAFNDLATASEQLIASGGSIAEVAGFVSSVDLAFTALKETIDRELKTALDGLQRGYEALIKTLDLQKQTAEAAKSVAEESLTAITSVFDVIKESISSILGDVLPAQTAAQGAAFISDALLAAQTTGYLPESNALSSAIAAARTGLGAENFSTSLDMKMANMRLVAQLTGIQDIAGEQKSVAELQLEIATKQLESLDAQIEQAKTQYDSDVAATQAYYDNQLQMAQNQVNELRGINGSVMTMTQALAAFGAAVNAERAASTASSNDRTAAISQMYLDILHRAPDTAGLASWVSSGMSLDEVRAGILASQEAQGFAEGGRYPGGLAMVGERGPELINFSNPGMVYTAAQTQSLLGGAGNAEVTQELRSLREENKVQARSIVQLNLRMARVLERWDGDGLPTERVETV